MAECSTKMEKKFKGAERVNARREENGP